ncbi:MAG: hypothetical protein P1P89_19400 [Desulfobacterales bacterium]|nr:hypothetical protein [Desulfobacterales bacterium]
MNFFTGNSQPATRNISEERMLPIFRVIIFVLASILPAAPCLGGTLAISTRTTLTIYADRIQADVFVENNGSEPAYGVQANLYIFDRLHSADAVDQLGVKQNRSFQLDVPLPANLKGEFPFVGEVIYHDVSRLTLTALSAGTFKLGSSGAGILSGRAPELTLKANESLSVQVSSGDSKSRDVFATLYLPRRLTTPQKQKHIKLKPFETAAVDFPLTHRHGAGSATYPVFCTLTYQDSGVAYAAVVQTTVHVKDFQNWFVQTRLYWLGVGALIILGWVWVGVTAGGLLIDDC